MSRGDGFPVADVDSSYLDDAKLRALWQRLQDTDRMARAVLLHHSTVLASWRHGERVTVTEAAPVWLPADADLVLDLVAVKLLDRSGRVPLQSWREWFGVADAKREKARDRWARYNAKRDAVTASEPRGNHAGTATSGPTGPSVPTEGDPLTPPSGEGRVNPRANGTNPRARGTNPRAVADIQAAAARRMAQKAALLRAEHNHGAHADEPHPSCPYCNERAATA